jgi:hypothetical protein
VTLTLVNSGEGIKNIYKSVQRGDERRPEDLLKKKGKRKEKRCVTYAVHFFSRHQRQVTIVKGKKR